MVVSKRLPLRLGLIGLVTFGIPPIAAPAQAQVRLNRMADVSTDSGHYTVEVGTDGSVVLTAAAFPRPMACVMRGEIALRWASVQRAVVDSGARASGDGRIELEDEAGVNTGCHAAIRRVIRADGSSIHLHLHDDGFFERASFALTKADADLLARTVSLAANLALSIKPTGASAMERAYFQNEVTRVVQQIPGTGNLRYPDRMRRAKIQGEVLAHFVVDTTGQYVPGTLNAIRSTDPDFTEAVLIALPKMRFYPAELSGKKVRQLVVQPFTFSLAY